MIHPYAVKGDFGQRTVRSARRAAVRRLGCGQVDERVGIPRQDDSGPRRFQDIAVDASHKDAPTEYRVNLLRGKKGLRRPARLRCLKMTQTDVQPWQAV